MLTGALTGSCALSNLNGLGGHKNAEEAMVRFVTVEMASPGVTTLRYPYPFYTFCTGPVGRYGWSKYGEEFAAYINEHGLGKAVSPGVGNNTKNYGAGHPCQTWVWMPDYDGIVKWWNARKK